MEEVLFFAPHNNNDYLTR